MNKRGIALLIFGWLALGGVPPLWAQKCEKSFKLISWNVQTFGDVNPRRQALIRSAYAAVFSTSAIVFAAQEIAHERGRALLENLLPGGEPAWQASFTNTPDSQDNGIFSQVNRATITAQGFLFANKKTGKPEKSKAVHPVRWAHIRVDDLDFLLLSLHLTFKGGEASASKKEFFAVLDWIKDYLQSAGHDPDIIITGDFNLPSGNGKVLSARHSDKKWIALEDAIQEHGFFADGANKLHVLVDEPTSRPQKKPANNYDHFVVSSSIRGRFLSAGRVRRELVDAADARKSARVSDHYPIEGVLCSKGDGIALDGR